MDIVRTLIYDSPLITVCLSGATLANLPGAFRDFRLVAAHACFWTTNTLAVEYELVDLQSYAFASLVFLASTICSLVYSRYPKVVPLRITHLIANAWCVIFITATVADPSQLGWTAVGVVSIGVLLAMSRGGRILVRENG